MVPVVVTDMNKNSTNNNNSTNNYSASFKPKVLSISSFHYLVKYICLHFMKGRACKITYVVFVDFKRY